MAKSANRSSAINAKVFKIAAFLMLLLVIPITVLLAVNQQNNQSRADNDRSRSTLQATPSTVVAGGKGYATWFMAQPQDGDWIGLYPKGTGDTAFISRVLLNSCQNTKGPNNLHFGMCQFILPNIIGMYEYRLFVSGSERHGENDSQDDQRSHDVSTGWTLAATAPVTVIATPSITILPSRFITIFPTIIPTRAITIFPTRFPTCTPRPACLNSVPRCEMPEPIGGWCPGPSLLPTRE